jgi:hypothetical protein
MLVTMRKERHTWVCSRNVCCSHVLQIWNSVVRAIACNFWATTWLQMEHRQLFTVSVFILDYNWRQVLFTISVPVPGYTFGPGYCLLLFPCHYLPQLEYRLMLHLQPRLLFTFSAPERHYSWNTDYNLQFLCKFQFIVWAQAAVYKLYATAWPQLKYKLQFTIKR